MSSTSWFTLLRKGWGMSRLLRKMKKRIKKILNSPEIKEALREMSDSLLTYGRAIKYMRTPPMTDEQKKALFEERGISIHTETMTPEEAMERYGLTKEYLGL